MGAPATEVVCATAAPAEPAPHAKAAASAAPRIAVVDYHKGNLSSMARGLMRAGAQVQVTDDPAQIRAAQGIVIPGVGSFFDAMTCMAELGLADAVTLAAQAGIPLLGVCLGLQLLLDRGDEGVPAGAQPTPCADAYGAGLAPGQVFEAEDRLWTRGLGLVHGSCTKLESPRLKVPHVGWDQVHVTEAGRASSLLAGFTEGANMYFTHSYAAATDVEPADAVALTHYTRSFACMVQHGNVYGCQFHPEKSSAHGHELLVNFVRIVSDAADTSREVRA